MCHMCALVVSAFSFCIRYNMYVCTCVYIFALAKIAFIYMYSDATYITAYLSISAILTVCWL